MVMVGWSAGVHPGTWDDGGAVARGLLGRLGDQVAEARAVLDGAGQVSWVSASADAYRARVEDGLRTLDRLAGRLDDVGDLVLRHTSAATRAHEEHVRDTGLVGGGY